VVVASRDYHRSPYRRALRALHSSPALRSFLATSLIAASTLGITPRLGSEFLPHLEEGNFWIRAPMPLLRANSLARRVERRAVSISRKELRRALLELRDKRLQNEGEAESLQVIEHI
jgi:Cu/Ag efflux pump CusA